jgi:hypothetical protein
MSRNNPAPYTEGSVWSLQFARTKSGESDEYVKFLRDGWKPVMEEAKRQKVILSYRVLLSNFTSPGDWDVMILIELENMAALDGYRDKLGRIVDELPEIAACASPQFLEPGCQFMRLVREVVI